MLICGLDEAGRGPLAGPVVGGAVILSLDFPIELLNDSKKLSEKKRLFLEILIKEKSLAWGLGIVDHREIDRINILQASLLAMQLAFEQAAAMFANPKSNIGIFCLADGRFCPSLNVPCKAVPKADASVPAVMAASILAKTERDRLMCEYAKQYPEYGYERHKGYPTAEHRRLCRLLGHSPIQRKTFSY